MFAAKRVKQVNNFVCWAIWMTPHTIKTENDLSRYKNQLKYKEVTTLINKPDKNKKRQKRHQRIRRNLSGTAQCPRLSVFRSNKNIYAQLIDDVEGVTLASASTLEENIAGQNKTEQAQAVGELIAKRALEQDIDSVVFDRSGYKYHGRVQALAEATREHGLKF